VRIGGHIARHKVWVMGSNISDVCNVRANYGTICVLQSCFLASFRMSCTAKHASLNTLCPETNAHLGGSRTLGEMESMQLAASGLSHVMSEFQMRSNMCIVDVCRTCRLISILCTCNGNNSAGYDRVCVPYDTIEAMVSTRIVFGMNIMIGV